ncbi:hypothetical protein [Gloeocapsopsis dulcis]|uniref:Uncharacterized protein n=1 Tax=Gloeocapsopsis dulcis AAB1 = 1H9 TaxID=1433147 RepID=A0A6N8FUK5_9CHRO|nr:hypothetical protein [Gloeocapsopsis dulcis]MUL35626.1 hypothetical protein [Gloeocapsopsis dulcis AAB1 = 1H9]WNN87472.1 hypothetical protein P0S91_14155 [Gloeocapsopsis dulcis]
MPTTSTVRQILSDSQQGLLPYLHHQLATEEFAQFRSQFVFHAEESSTDVNSGDRTSELQTAPLISLKFTIIVDSHISADDATILALEFQEKIDCCLVKWSQKNKQLFSSVTQIKGSFGRLEEVRYHGGFLPGFSIERQFRLHYKTSVTATDNSSFSGNELYKPGEIVPESGLYELTGPRGGNKGQEVTATKGEPFPPTPDSGMYYKLVTLTKHKNS